MLDNRSTFWKHTSSFRKHHLAETMQASLHPIFPTVGKFTRVNWSPLVKNADKDSEEFKQYAEEVGICIALLKIFNIKAYYIPATGDVSIDISSISLDDITERLTNNLNRII